MRLSQFQSFAHWRAVILMCGALALSISTLPQSNTTTSEPQSTSNSTKSGPTTIDLNKASAKDLDTLPGVGPSMVKKIIAGRPYSSVDDLSKAGISPATIKKITPLVTVGSGGTTTKRASSPAAATSASNVPPAKTPRSSSASGEPGKSTTITATAGAPGPGVVWVNLDSGTYHYQGSRYYGKTKNGKYMTEADAMKAGYKPAKNEKKTP